MPRVQPIYSDFFYEPLTEDVEALLGRFQQADSVRFEVFSALWRELSFSDVFRGFSPDSSEARRFCRLALATAVRFFLPPYSYLIRTGGLYLMFAFFHAQPASPPLRIRLALKDWAHVEVFLQESRLAQHYDVVYVYEKLAAEKAFLYTAMPHHLCFQRQVQMKRSPECLEFLRRTTAVQDFMSAALLDEVKNIQTHYEKLKEGTVQVSGKANVTLPDFHQRLEACMSEFLTWQMETFPSQTQKNPEDDEGSPEEEEEESSSSRRARLLSSIKQKSYSSFQKPQRSRRHRNAEIPDQPSSSSEQVQGQTTPQSKKHPSLRARTWMSLGKGEKESKSLSWLLSVPEQAKDLQRFRRTTPFRM